MPVRRVLAPGAIEPSRYAWLRDALAAEWVGAPGTLPPPLIEELADQDDLILLILEVRVYWSLWDQVPLELRADLIREVFDEVYPDQNSHQLRYVEGLTQADATAQGLDWPCDDRGPAPEGE